MRLQRLIAQLQLHHRSHGPVLNSRVCSLSNCLSLIRVCLDFEFIYLHYHKKDKTLRALQDLKRLSSSSWAGGNTGKSQHERRGRPRSVCCVFPVKPNVPSQQYIKKTHSNVAFSAPVSEWIISYIGLNITLVFGVYKSIPGTCVSLWELKEVLKTTNALAGWPTEPTDHTGPHSHTCRLTSTDHRCVCQDKQSGYNPSPMLLLFFII